MTSARLKRFSEFTDQFRDNSPHVFVPTDTERLRGKLFTRDFGKLRYLDPEQIRRYCTHVVLSQQYRPMESCVIDFPVWVPIVIQSMVDVVPLTSGLRLIWSLGGGLHLSPSVDIRAQVMGWSDLTRKLWVTGLKNGSSDPRMETYPSYYWDPTLNDLNVKATDDGSVVFYKAVGQRWTTYAVYDKEVVYKPHSGPHHPVRYRDTPECGDGLHVSPTPWQASTFRVDSSRFVECRVHPDDGITVLDWVKVKVAKLTVGREVDLFGDPIDPEEARLWIDR